MIDRMNELDINVGWIKKHLVKIVVGVFVLILVFSSVRTVGPEEEGVVVQLGGYNRTVPPGLNFILPFGIEKMHKIPVQRQLKQEFGFRTSSSGGKSEYAKEAYIDESIMLTGDLNLTDVEWVVQYRISDSYKYLFKVRNAES